MESYENLRLEKRDKIPKLNLFERLFKKGNAISEQNLDFLEERYSKEGQEKEYQKTEEQKSHSNLTDFEDFVENPILDSNFLATNSKQKEQAQQSDMLLLDDLFLEDKELKSLEKNENTELLLNADEREAVLNDLDLNAKEIPFRVVLITLCFMLFALMLFVPKIYVRNNIYYASRNIIQLQAQIDSLREENKHIKKQLEDIKFKNLTQELDF